MLPKAAGRGKAMAKSSGKVSASAVARAELVMANAAQSQEKQEKDEQFENDLLAIVVELYSSPEKLPRAKRRPLQSAFHTKGSFLVRS